MALYHTILGFSILLLVFSPAYGFPRNQTLIFPLKTQILSRESSTLKRLSSSSSDKLSFRNGVALTLSLSVGSPPQNVTMVLDTGSELPWLHCKQNPNLKSFFSPDASASYLPVRCSSPVCTTQTRDLPVPAACDPNNTNLCHVAVSYADGSSIEGSLANENFIIGSSTRPGTVFGCMDSGQSSNPEEDDETTGLMGMNRGSLSFITQLRLPKFSYCIAPSDSSGILVLGDEVLPSLNYTPLVLETTPLPSFDRFAYTVQMQGIRVGPKILDIPKSAFVPDHTGAGQTMVDSGTQFTFLLGSVYTALKTEFSQQTKSVLKVLNDPSFVFQGAMDLCYRVGPAITDFSNLPRVGLMFEGGVEMSVSGEKLLYKVPGKMMGNDSVYCFTFGNSDLLGIEAFLIGHHHQQNMCIQYDLANSRLGFAEARCDQAAQRLRMSL